MQQRLLAELEVLQPEQEGWDVFKIMGLFSCHHSDAKSIEIDFYVLEQVGQQFIDLMRNSIGLRFCFLRLLALCCRVWLLWPLLLLVALRCHRHDQYINILNLDRHALHLPSSTLRPLLQEHKPIPDGNLLDIAPYYLEGTLPLALNNLIQHFTIKLQILETQFFLVQILITQSQGILEELAK